MRRAAILGLLVASCASEPPPSSASIEMTLGTVDAAGAGFFPLTGDQPLVPGSQGGFHVWVKYRLKDYTPGTLVVRREVRRVADDRLVLRPTDNPVDVGAPDATGSWELPSPVPSFMCPTPIGVAVRDQAVRIKVTVLDPDTEMPLCETSTIVTPRCPPEGDPQHAFCESICSG